MKKDILVVEDDTYLRTFICKSLINTGYSSYGASSGEECIHLLKKQCFDLVIMDLDLGDINGDEIIKLMRKQSIDLPVIVVSTFNNLDIKVDLFETGCDDYITKPFYMDELIARIKRLIARTPTTNIPKNEILRNDIIEFNGIQLNFMDSTVVKNGVTIEITKKIFDLLTYFLKNPNILISKEQLLSKFWGDSDIYPENTLTVHIHKLRTIIEPDPSKPIYLITKRGLGYIFNLTN